MESKRKNSGNDGQEQSLEQGSQEYEQMEKAYEQRKQPDPMRKMADEMTAKMEIEQNQKNIADDQANVAAKQKIWRQGQLGKLTMAYNIAMAQAATTDFSGDASKLRSMSSQIDSAIHTGSELDNDDLNDFFSFMNISNVKDLKKSYANLAQTTGEADLENIAKEMGTTPENVQNAYKYMATSADEKSLQSLFSNEQKNKIDISEIKEPETDNQDEDDDWMPGKKRYM